VHAYTSVPTPARGAPRAHTFDPELTDTNLLALSWGGGERERKIFMGVLLLDERVGLRPGGGGEAYSHEVKASASTMQPIATMRRRKIFRGEGAQSARER
jgi:hypothetical protein